MSMKLANGTKTIDEVEQAITNLKLEIGQDKKNLADKVTEVKALEQQLMLLMGDARKVETDEWKYTMHVPNPAKKSWYSVVQEGGTAEQRRLNVDKLKKTLPELIKVETKEKVDIDSIKQRLADGELVITDSGKLVTVNGEIVPGIIGELKPASVSAKAKEK